VLITYESWGRRVRVWRAASADGGAAARGRIKSVAPNEFWVRLTTASADLNAEAAWEAEYCAKLERFYHVLSEEELRAARLAARAAAAKAKTFVARPIRHPNFRNVSAEEAVELLGAAPPGEPLLRPSGRGTHLLVLSLKVARPRRSLRCWRADRERLADSCCAAKSPLLGPCRCTPLLAQSASLPGWAFQSLPPRARARGAALLGAARGAAGRRP